jgi:uncharacterized protein
MLVVYAVLAYAAMAGGALAMLEIEDRSPWLVENAWLGLPTHVAHTYGITLGVTFGFAIAAATRVLVPRVGWARQLHRELRPFAAGMSSGVILCLALLSGVGEELLFRGLLQPYLGVIGQSIVFGLLHQVRGPSRWVWAAWATAIGLAFGAMFALTGSLLGPIAGHAVINALNLFYLRSHDPEPPRRSLGGLLGHRS